MRLTNIFHSNKTLKLILIISSLLLALKSNDGKLSFQFDSYAVLAIKTINSPAPVKIKYSFSTFLPVKDFKLDTLLTPDKVNILNLKINKPGKASIVVNDTIHFYAFLIPKDTLFVDIDFSRQNDFPENIKFYGQYSKISSYFLQKEKQALFDNKRMLNKNLPLQMFARRIDSLTSLELKNLDDFNFENNLPFWFLEYEKTEILSVTNFFKLSLIPYRRINLGINDSIPENYYDFCADIKINNAGLFSHWYYLFLSSYFYKIYHTKDIDSLDKEERIKITTEKSIILADSLLSGEVRDIFKSWQISYLIDRGYIFLADSFINTHLGTFKNKNYADFLKNYRTNTSFLKKGDDASGFYLPDENNQHRNLSDFKGKIILLNFWFPDCAPCIKEIPFEKDLAQTFSDKKFVLINICTKSSKENWLEAIEKFRLKGVNLYASSNWTKILTNNYLIKAYPHYVLIDANGKIIKNHCARPSDNLKDFIKILVSTDY